MALTCALMKNLARGAAILSFSLIVASCSKKEALNSRDN